MPLRFLNPDDGLDDFTVRPGAVVGELVFRRLLLEPFPLKFVIASGAAESVLALQTAQFLRLRRISNPGLGVIGDMIDVTGGPMRNNFIPHIVNDGLGVSFKDSPIAVPTAPAARGLERAFV